MPNGQVPILELKSNGKILSQSVAILRFLGMQHGYYPRDPLEAHKVNELIDGFGDVASKIFTPAFNKEADTTAIFGT